MRILTIIFSILFLFASFFAGALFFIVNYPTINLEEQTLSTQITPTIVLDDKGNEWARFQLDRREPITLDAIPRHTIHAFLAAEDHNFFNHHGISWRGIVRSVWVNLRHGRRAQGASTITQQLVKLIFLTQEKTFTRKIKEQITALILEYQCTKEQILQAYLNNIYCGGGIYGIQAAAQRFWGKNAYELSIAQGALLAALVKSPGSYCPLYTKNHAAVLERRNLILKLMLQQNFITHQEYEHAIGEPLSVILEKTTTGDHIREYLRQTLETLIGRNELYAGGLIIKTTINSAMQKNAEKLFAETVKNIRSKAPVDGALITLETATGAIKALIGGCQFSESQFNRALQANRQMGSLFKPLIYATATEHGIYFNEVDIDEPLTIKDWSPQNANRRFEGPMTLAHSLITSNNIIAIKTFLRVGAEPIIQLAEQCHLAGPFMSYPSLALGCTECTLLQATALYATFAHQGTYQEPFMIEWIKNRWSKKIWKHSGRPHRAISSKTCSQLVQTLKLVPKYLTQRLQKNWIPVETIAKTGTTNDMRTCWFVGATPSYTTGIYLGCDDNRSLRGITSSTRTIAPLWLEYNKTFSHPNTTFYGDADLRLVSVNSRTGQLTQPHDPQAIQILVP